MDDLAKDVDYLGHIEAFQRCMKHVHVQREQAIRDLKGADDGKVRELSGTISAYTDLLDTYGWEDIQRRLHA